MSTYIYYVYAYLRKNNSTPYYIGKGRGNRAYNKNHTVSVPTDKSKIAFLETNLSEIGALALERRYIRWYGRKINNTGILHNITEGGDGGDTSLSPNFIKAMRNRPSIKGKSYEQVYGKEKAEVLKKERSKSNINRGKRSEETKQKISQTRKTKIKDGTLNSNVPPQTSESILKRVASRLLNSVEISCPHCGLISRNKTNMKRWHFDNCKKIQTAL